MKLLKVTLLGTMLTSTAWAREAKYSFAIEKRIQNSISQVADKLGGLNAEKINGVMLVALGGVTAVTLVNMANSGDGGAVVCRGQEEGGKKRGCVYFLALDANKEVVKKYEIDIDIVSKSAKDIKFRYRKGSHPLNNKRTAGIIYLELDHDFELKFLARNVLGLLDKYNDSDVLKNLENNNLSTDEREDVAAAIIKRFKDLTLANKADYFDVKRRLKHRTLDMVKLYKEDFNARQKLIRKGSEEHNKGLHKEEFSTENYADLLRDTMSSDVANWFKNR